MNILPVVGGIISLFGAFRQQQQADTAAGLSREALELQKRVVDAYLKELEELKPYREAMRELAATRMTMAPMAWSRWTSDPWRLTPSLPPIQKLLNPPTRNSQKMGMMVGMVVTAVEVKIVVEACRGRSHGHGLTGNHLDSEKLRGYKCPHLETHRQYMEWTQKPQPNLLKHTGGHGSVGRKRAAERRNVSSKKYGPANTYHLLTGANLSLSLQKQYSSHPS
jgi:hypothetical protein